MGDQLQCCDQPQWTASTRTSSVPVTKGESMLYPGTPAPDFSLPDQDGHIVSLAALRGHWVLLWWYPKASTPG
ncbi:MAG: hypothetical protein NVSMB4_04510 [Acidimicrobiales bacterium]